MRNNRKTSAGITLIALVVTVIVLLLLAGISVMMLTGNNGILNRAGQAKEETEMAQLKEQAELVKQAMIMEKKLNEVEDELTRSELVSGIKNDNSFSGSKKIGYKIVTADNKYDVKVDSNLNITVEKHVSSNGSEIKLAFTETETESRAIVLKVTATIENLKVPTPEELQQQIDPEGTGDSDDLKAMLAASNYLMPFKTWKDLYNYYGENWNNYYGVPLTPASFFELGIKNNYSEIHSETIYEFLIEVGAYKPDIIISCSNGEETTIRDNGTAEFVIIENGKYTVSATDVNEDYGEESKKITKCDIEIYSDIQSATTTIITKDNKRVPVPSGFAYGNDDKVGKLSNGFVITDKIDKNHYSTGNEFVWIPVDKDTLKVIGSDGNITDKVMAKVSTGDFAGTDKNGNINYEGVLYKFSGISSQEMTNYGQGTTKFREPALISYYDNNTEKPDGSDQTYLGQIGLTAEQFETELIEGYNAMIKSIQTYGGFYVARYEMGLENNKVISKLGRHPSSTSDEATKYWYGLYNMAKTYTTNSVQSSMIWGSQYDAMFNFALTGADKTKVTEENENFLIIKHRCGVYEGSDCINNIYDLQGNREEWTLSAFGDSTRGVRSGWHHRVYGNRKYK